jgi:addiction module HigA family antidote
MPRIRTHPGEVLAEEYMKPLGLSANGLGRALGIPGNRISDIVRGRRDVSVETAILLGRHFDVDPRFWLNLQTAYDLSRAESEVAARERLKDKAKATAIAKRRAAAKGDRDAPESAPAKRRA